ncbi:MAG: hypothetical protein TREMPRED_005517, partial [Tremellales sp. Tagirdzhanova-0007]
PALAAIRFQFWRDALNSIWAADTTVGGTKGVVPQHPVAVMLAEMKMHRPVQKYYLTQMIDQRAKILSRPPASATLESHLSTHAPLSNSLLLGPLPLLLPPTHPSIAHISHTLSHISTLLTTVTLLRTLPILVSSKRQLNLPSDICETHGIVEEDVLRNGPRATGLRDGCLEVGTRGMDELITARRDLKESNGKVVPPHVMPLFLAAVPAETYLKRLEKHDFDVFHPDMQRQDWRLIPRLLDPDLLLRGSFDVLLPQSANRSQDLLRIETAFAACCLCSSFALSALSEAEASDRPDGMGPKLAQIYTGSSTHPE